MQRDNDRLTEQLRKAEIVIDVQKNVRARLARTPAGPETPIQVPWVRREQWPPTFWCSVNP
jgi:hypothetical protein